LNIDASLNGAYIALGVLYGRGDFDRTIDIAMRAGQDSDCNPASAGGIVGTMIGYQAIPARWTDPLPAIADKRFSYTDYSFNSIVQSTIERTKRVARQEGGSVDAESLIIPPQEPEKLKLEQFRPGKVMDRIKYDDPRWAWQGPWEKTLGSVPIPRSKAAGAAAVVQFEGTGALLVGPLMPEGGVAEIYLDGKLMAKVDAYNDDGVRDGEGLWGKFDLPDGPHALRVLVKGEPYAGSQGAWFGLEDLIVFRK
jgi:hypothetical protein